MFLSALKSSDVCDRNWVSVCVYVCVFKVKALLSLWKYAAKWNTLRVLTEADLLCSLRAVLHKHVWSESLWCGTVFTSVQRQVYMFVLELGEVWVCESLGNCAKAHNQKNQTRSEQHVSFGTEHTQLFYLHTRFHSNTLKHWPTSLWPVRNQVLRRSLLEDTQILSPALPVSAPRLRLFLWECCQWIYGSGLCPLKFLRVSTLISLRAGRVDKQPLRVWVWVDEPWIWFLPKDLRQLLQCWIFSKQ